MSFKINSLYLTDGYKVGHKAMLAPGTTKLYGTWIPRSTKHAPKGITKVDIGGKKMIIKLMKNIKHGLMKKELKEMLIYLLQN